MHTISSIAMGMGAIVLLVWGVVRVFRDLVDRSPHDSPLIEDDGLAWSRRYQGNVFAPPQSAPRQATSTSRTLAAQSAGSRFAGRG